jgi:hypothetical protein
VPKMVRTQQIAFEAGLALNTEKEDAILKINPLILNGRPRSGMDTRHTVRKPITTVQQYPPSNVSVK